MSDFVCPLPGSITRIVILPAGAAESTVQYQRCGLIRGHRQQTMPLAEYTEPANILTVPTSNEKYSSPTRDRRR